MAEPVEKEKMEVIEAARGDADVEGDDAWFWGGYLHDEEREPEWIKEALKE